MENQQKEIRHMQATESGIIFYSVEKQLACMSSVDSNGNIINTLVTIYSNRFPHLPFVPRSFVIKEAFKNKFEYLFTGFFDIILILLAALQKDLFILLGVSAFVLLCSLKLFNLLNTVYELKAKNGKAHSTARFIAASHKVTNAYNNLQRVPTIEEAKKYSCFSFNSKFIEETLIILNFTSVSIALAINPTRSFLWYTIFLLIVPRICDSLFKTNKLLPLQKFITSEPTDKELEVAITAVKCFEQMEKNFKVTWVK